jgi:TonB-linked SusC/RagA family outer membrane protein
MKQRIYLLLFILFPLALRAQQKLSGSVHDGQDGRTLPGATVRLKLSGAVTVTDAQGNFSLAAPLGRDTLVVAFIGYQGRSLAVQGPFKEPINMVLLPGAHNIGEVLVSTGYQQLSRERATGSFDHLDNELIDRAVSPNILSRLDGVAGGVLFDKHGNSVTNFSVRGLSTLTASITGPLIVLDNFPYDGDVANINPNDVESVTVLKDAAAASIWGVRAGNGVVVITTKRGRNNQAMRVSINSSYTVSAKPDVFSTHPVSSSDFIDLEQFLFAKGYYNGALNNGTHPLVSPVVELLGQVRSGAISAAQANGQIDALRGIDVRSDFDKYVYRGARNQQHSFSLSGGGDKANYIVSVGYDKDLQNLVGNAYDRLTVRDANTFHPLKNLELQTSIQYTKSNTILDSQGGYGSILPGAGKASLLPYSQLTGVVGKHYRAAFIDTAGQGKLLDWRYRPVSEIGLADNRVRLNEVLLNAGLKYRLLPSLSAEVRYQYENSSTDGRNYYSTDTYFARNLVNMFTQVSGGVVNYVVPYGGILDQSFSRLLSNDIRGQLNYDHDWGQQHRLDVIFGGEVRQNTTDGTSGRTYGFSGDTYTSQAADQVNRYPTYDNVAGSSVIPYQDSFSGRLNRNVSLYGNAAYSYLGRYTVSASARKDANNLFGVESNRKWVPLWSAGAAWLVSAEPFYHWDVMPYMKLRATFGYSGNVNNSIPALTTIRYVTPNFFNSINNLPFAAISNYPNPNLRWEKVGMTNVALDFATRGNRLSGSLEYYYKNPRDLIGLVPADPTAGTGSVLNDNSAELKEHGVDITLNSLNLDGAFKWNTSLLFSLNKNKVAKYLYSPASYSSYINSGNITPVVGQPAASLISYKWAGLDPVNGNPMVYFNGKPSEDYSAVVDGVGKNDLVYSGSAVPQVFGAFRNDFSFKSFSLSVNISYRFDYYFRKYATGYSSLFSNWLGFDDYGQRWQKPGDELHTNVPSLSYPADGNRDAVYDLANITVLRADNIRLQDIRLSYSFNRSDWAGIPFRSLQLYAFASNLGIIWRANKLGLDPDYGNALPAPRAVSIGCKIEL